MADAAMRKPKVHKLDYWCGPMATSGRIWGYSRCFRFLFQDIRNYSKTWGGVPLARRCKNCLRAEGKR